MSAGEFVRRIYQSNDGLRNFPIRIQPETAEAVIDGEANDGPGGAASVGLPTVKVSAGVREYGVIPRKITLALAEGATEPDDYTGAPLQIVVLEKSVWDSATFGTQTTYLGTTWDNISRRDEIVN